MSSGSSTVAKGARAEPLPPADSAPGSHGSELARQLSAQWRQGRRLSVEQFLAELADSELETAATVRLICEEIWLREEAGEKVEAAELLERFPHLQTELELLLACYGLFQDEAPIDFPSAGEELGEFRLLSELGRGATGRVFLATQPSLSDRPVVVKLTSLEVAEHLSLSRLQHTGIVPLYLVQDFPERGLRALCMPYLGGASLDAVLSALGECPPEKRSGKRLVEALSRLERTAPAPLRFESPALDHLAGKSYEQAVCWIGACLADALHYAHQRGLLHLDLKPSNVLLAGDGQPMLLDFHLARGPVAPQSSAGDSLGGTRGYMSPEQAAAIGALRAGAGVEAAVDARSDVYSLGRLLYELLGGPVAADNRAPPITQFNRTVSRGLEDILAKCLSLDPHDRYPNAAALTEDLCRHLADLPLLGLPNRSLVERWQKWRRRKPQALKRLVAVATLIVACSAAALYAVRRQANAAHAALDKAAESLARSDYAGAIDRLRDGLEGLRYVPGQANLKRSLRERLSAAQQLRLGADLHKLVDRLRFRDSGADVSATDAAEIDRGCSALWQDRERLLARFADSADAAEVRTDLLDLALLWASLKVRGALDEHRNAALRDAIELLAEAEQSLGSSMVLQQERQTFAAELADNHPNPAPRAAHDKAPRNVWEHYALGRLLLRSGDLNAAAAEFQQALDQAPDSFWPNYYAGLCAYRRENYQQALNAFYACVALAPRSAECFYNRGLAYAALEQLEPAIHDYSRALELNPALALAALHRGQLYLQLEDSTLAAADFAAALKHGADPADVYYHLARLHLAQHDRPAARADLHRALQHRPNDEDALSLLRRLK